MTHMKLWRVDTLKGASLVKARDIPEALEEAVACRTLWGPTCKAGEADYELPTFDNITSVREVTSDNTTEGL